jgi:NAD(P)-dependent dehydrogenase (short-subunit alcohol dehydrogenase family)
MRPTRRRAGRTREEPRDREHERTWRGKRDSGRHPDAGQARAHHGRRQQPLDRLGHRQGDGGAGATLAFTYQGDALKKRVEPLAAEVGSKLVLPCDVTDKASVDAVFAELGRQWGKLDFLVHAIAFSDKAELDGRYVDTTEKNFTQTMLISCFSFTALAQRARS